MTTWATRQPAKIARKRVDWQHKTSRRLAETGGQVILERLNTKGMTAAERTESGKRKRHLNREILAAGWRGLRDKIAYKAAVLTEVHPAYTSQRCAGCGHVAAENRLSQSEFECGSCGSQSNADLNAALNILAAGTAASGRRGALALATPVTRQYPRAAQRSQSVA